MMHQVLATLEECQMTLVQGGDRDTAQLVAVAILELRIKLNKIQDSELKVLCDAMLHEVEAGPDAVSPKISGRKISGREIAGRQIAGRQTARGKTAGRPPHAFPRFAETGEVATHRSDSWLRRGWFVHHSAHCAFLGIRYIRPTIDHIVAGSGLARRPDNRAIMA